MSNFLIWQAAYAEYYFTEVLWPDFGRQEFEQALACFGTRERRFGDVSAVTSDDQKTSEKDKSIQKDMLS